MPADTPAELPERAPTITDVARLAGVAPSTVSRSFTRPGRVNHRTREHVLAVAEELGYRPNPAAQALESGRTRTIALIVPDITNPYFSGLVKGAERAAAATGLTLVLGDTQESPHQEAAMLDRLSRAVDGQVVAASRLTDDDLRGFASRSPVVLVNRPVAEIACVVADYDAGTRQIVDHLHSLGHDSFVFAAGPVESWSGQRRWRGLRIAARRRGLRATRFGPFQPTLAGGPAAADAALSAGATAVVCHNDMLAIGVLRRLSDRGVVVPAQLSVVGFDDIFGADFCHPPLTTLGEHTEDAGMRAVEALVRLIPRRRTDEPARVLPTHLVIRGSTGPPRDGGEPQPRGMP